MELQGDMGHVESYFSPFGVIVSVSARQLHGLHQMYHRLRNYLEVPSSASKMNFEPMLRLVQIVHVSCTDTNIVSKRTETRLHMSHIN
jgi:hypothetical protein